MTIDRSAKTIRTGRWTRNSPTVEELDHMLPDIKLVHLDLSDIEKRIISHTDAEEMLAAWPMNDTPLFEIDSHPWPDVPTVAASMPTVDLYPKGTPMHQHRNRPEQGNPKRYQK